VIVCVIVDCELVVGGVVLGVDEIGVGDGDDVEEVVEGEVEVDEVDVEDKELVDDVLVVDVVSSSPLLDSAAL